MQSGNIVVNTVANTVINQTVNFEEEFDGAPTVVLNSRTTSPNKRFVSASSISRTGFQVNVFSDVSSELGVDWIAYSGS